MDLDPNLTISDVLVLENLLDDIKAQRSEGQDREAVIQSRTSHHEETVKKLQALNDPHHSDFEPSVVFTWDLRDLRLYPWLDRWILQPYIGLATRIVRHETDVVMLSHILLYLTTSVPSAIFLFYRFSWTHGILHWLMQSYYTGTYTLLMHQHIHMGGVLKPKYRWLDMTFPYVTDRLMGHTWNSYYYHHVKHHHVEGNGPDDLSSTIRYQRDDLFDFLCYFGRFLLCVWFELPRYFFRKGNLRCGFKAGTWEILSLASMYWSWKYLGWKPTLFCFVIPFMQLRLGLMVGNWGQHAFVDEVDPDSDFRSSITLIDVASNRFCYNDGYHTSHHLNPRRHWRDHPVAFLQQKDRYTTENALVFRDIDYIMITVRLMRKDYNHLAKCLVPLGDQIGMEQAEIAQMLRTKTRRFTEEEIRRKFPQRNQSHQ
ncbi:Fatty acid desaturase [Aspergillus parasiticus SU-1]|uniref:Fatty acid desaturase n=1 Tax=Aspergillus parasiticus (strain ATCC 56775 / NRRL 5862 / SRRC 143 / SU-1) TaxID=1403190 RepID=A0A0F0IK12_ASPPU|nr:Fatty acid desaturase [Aspergillus parasiticus SU-1]